MRKLFLAFTFIIFGFGTFQVNAAGLIDTISLGISGKPVDIAVNEATNKIYVADTTNKKIVVIDGTNNVILKRIVIDGNPLAIAVNQITNKIYVLSNGQDALGYYPLRTLIDGSDDTIVSEFGVFGGFFTRFRQSKAYESADISLSNDSNLIIVITKYFNEDGQMWRGAEACFRLDFETPVLDCGVASYETNQAPQFVKVENIDIGSNENITVRLIDGGMSWRIMKPGLIPPTTFFPFLNPIKIPVNCPSFKVKDITTNQ